MIAVSRPDKEITEEDIVRVVEAAKALSIPQDREVIHVLPQEYIVDDQKGIRNPVGMSGVRLEVNVHIVTAAATSAQNLYKGIRRTGIEVADLVLLSGGTRSDMSRLLIRLVAKGGAFGLHAILATQRPDGEAIAGLLKANLATRITFWLPSGVDYRLALNTPAGVTIPRISRIPGRMVARLSDGLRVLQGYHVSDEEIAALATRLRGEKFSPLSPLERELVTYALDCLDGEFNINILAEAFQGRISRNALKALARRWERAGWLTERYAANQARRVTGELLALLEVGGAPPA